jgi:hypothetical protein
MPMDADMADPTPELRRAVNAALRADRPTAVQSALLAAFFVATCGDCIDGRCHGRSPCGCARHEDSVVWRDPADTTT